MSRLFRAAASGEGSAVWPGVLQTKALCIVCDGKEAPGGKGGGVPQLFNLRASVIFHECFHVEL